MVKVDQCACLVGRERCSRTVREGQAFCWQHGGTKMNGRKPKKIGECKRVAGGAKNLEAAMMAKKTPKQIKFKSIPGLKPTGITKKKKTATPKKVVASKKTVAKKKTAATKKKAAAKKVKKN